MTSKDKVDKNFLTIKFVEKFMTKLILKEIKGNIAMLYILPIIALAFLSPCYGYLDGGTSSLLLQLIFGGLAGGMVFIKIYWKKLMSFIKLNKKT